MVVYGFYLPNNIFQLCILRVYTGKDLLMQKSLITSGSSRRVSGIQHCETSLDTSQDFYWSTPAPLQIPFFEDNFRSPTSPHGSPP